MTSKLIMNNKAMNNLLSSIRVCDSGANARIYYILIFSQMYQNYQL